MKRFLIPAMLAVLLAACWYDYHQWRWDRACRMFAAGDFSGARSAWSSAGRLPGRQGVAQFNKGVAAYRMGDYAVAGDDFRAASIHGDGRLRGRALYNLGTTLIRMASGPGAKAPGVAERHLRQAVTSLREALALNPADESAMVNLKAAQKRLAVILAGKDARNKDAAASAPRREPSAPGEPRKPGREPAKPGKATELDQEGARRRSAALDRDAALRMLDEARGREALRSARAYSRTEAGPTPPEKDW